MANLLVRPPWHLSASLLTPQAEYQHRREFLRRLGLGGAGLLAAAVAGETRAADAPAPSSPYPAKRNPDFNPKLELASSSDVYTYNNYYEFSTTKTRVHKLTGKFVIDPWSLAVTGLCENPFTMSAGDLATMFPLEERVYRFRCVEAWSMVVPWTGFPLAKLIEKAKPKADAKFVKFTTVNRPDQMPGINTLSEYPWPYTEGLRMDEARHPLMLIATGLYGEPLKKQNGAPLRLVVPWKYGYKSIKSLVKIEFVARQPDTLWETLNPVEYPFESNVDPGKPHPRWSQATERVLGAGGTVPTLKYNGYGDLVAKMY